MHAQAAVLRSRLAESGAWHTQATAWRAPHPALYNRWSLPDLPHPAYRRALTDENYQVNAVAVAPDGTWLATGGEDRTVRIWDMATGTVTRTLTLTPYDHPEVADAADSVSAVSVKAVAVAPDGTWLAATGTDGAVRIWDMATGTLTRALTGNPGLVGAVAISPDGAWLATAPRVLSGRVQIWDAATGTPASRLPGRLSMVRSVAVSPDGAWLATIASLSRKVRIRSVATGAVTRTLVSHLGRMRAVAISPDGTMLAIARSEAASVLREAEEDDAAGEAPVGEYPVRIWDVATGADRILTGHTAEVNAVVFSPDGAWLATAGEDRTVRVWSTVTGTPVAMMPATAPLTSCGFLPDGRGLIVAGAHGLYAYDFDPG